MTIVLKENEWAKDRIDNHDLGKHPFETLRRVARYYLDTGDYAQQEVRVLLDNFLIRCDPIVSVVKWSETLDKALKSAAKHKAINEEYIPISHSELKTIESIQSVQARRLAFTLLCLAKYWDVANGVSSHWVNSPDNEIMKMANINTSIRRQSLLYNQLYEAGLIRFHRRIDNTNVRVCYISGDDVELKITDFRNLGFQYKLYTGDSDCYRCQECGIVVKRSHSNKDGLFRSGRPQIYCRDCALATKVKRNVNGVMKSNRFGFEM